MHAPFYPVPEKTENWWLVVGEESTKSLMGIKRVTVTKETKVKMDFTVLEPGKRQLTLFLMSDSYVGVDQAPGFEVDVAEGMEEDDDEEEAEEE